MRRAIAPDQIWFADDLFTINRKWVHQFSDAMVERDAVTPFYLVGRPRRSTPRCATRSTRRLLPRVLLRGERRQHVLDAMHKDSKVDGHPPRGPATSAPPGSSSGCSSCSATRARRTKDMNRTLDMLHTIDPEVTLLSVAHPMKGTKFYDDVADRIVRPPGWEEATAAGSPSRCAYPREFYDKAQRMIWAETGLVKKLRKGEYDLELLKLAVKAPSHRLGAYRIARGAVA